MTEYLSLAIVGAAVSIIVQVIKSLANGQKSVTYASVIALSLLAGGVYYQYGNTALWQSALQILVFANAFYGFVIKNFEA